MNVLVTIAVLFALGMLALTVGKIIRNIICVVIVLVLGAFVWTRVLPLIFGEGSDDRLVGIIEDTIKNGVDTDTNVSDIDWQDPGIPAVPDASLEEVFAMKPDIERYVFSSMNRYIDKFRNDIAERGVEVSTEPPDIPTVEEFDAMTDREKERLKRAVLDFFAQAPPQTVDEDLPVPVDASATIAQGDFVANEALATAEGRAAIVRPDGGKPLLRLEDFSITNGPGLAVYLAVSPVGDVNVGFVSLGELKAEQGDQNYVIKTKAPLGGFKSIVVYSEGLEIPYAVAPLVF